MQKPKNLFKSRARQVVHEDIKGFVMEFQGEALEDLKEIARRRDCSEDFLMEIALMLLMEVDDAERVGNRVVIISPEGKGLYDMTFPTREAVKKLDDGRLEELEALFLQRRADLRSKRGTP